LSNDAAEPGQPFSQKSTKYLAGLVLNKSVLVKLYGTDRYGRTLGVVFKENDWSLGKVNLRKPSPLWKTQSKLSLTCHSLKLDITPAVS
jgi:hypothetical protein